MLTAGGECWMWAGFAGSAVPQWDRYYVAETRWLPPVAFFAARCPARWASVATPSRFLEAPNGQPHLPRCRSSRLGWSPQVSMKQASGATLIRVSEARNGQPP